MCIYINKAKNIDLENQAFMTVRGYLIILVISIIHSPALFATDEEIGDTIEDPAIEAKFYRTPEERREAGFKTPITDWLTVSSLLEIEKIYSEDHFEDGTRQDVYEPRTQTLQLGFDAEFTETLTASLVFEAEYQVNFTTTTEEAILKKELGDWDFEIGYSDLPFGEYYSQFITGPMLEFGETTSSVFVVEHGLHENFDVNGYVFDGSTQHNGSQTDPGWGAGMDFTNEEESIRLGVGYMSNLAESDENFLEDFNNAYIERVPAWNANLLIGFEDFEITAEVVRALKSFKELDANENKPAAYNLEAAWYYRPWIQFAVRLEHSREFSDNPEWQYGLAVSWRPGPRWNLSAEYLMGDYKKGFVTDDDDNELRDSHQLGFQVSFEF